MPMNDPKIGTGKEYQNPPLEIKDCQKTSEIMLKGHL